MRQFIGPAILILFFVGITIAFGIQNAENAGKLFAFAGVSSLLVLGWGGYLYRHRESYRQDKVRFRNIFLLALATSAVGTGLAANFILL